MPLDPSFSVAPVTAVIVLLVPAITHVSPFASTVDRILEVALGGVIGFAISFFLLPSSAHPLVVDAAAGTLDEMAALGELLAGFTQSLDVNSVTRIQDRIGQALVHMNVVGSEAEHERSARLAVGPNTEPLLRTLLRLRHDLVMIGRAVIVPLPEAFQTRLELPLAPVGVAFADYLRASGVALSVRRGLPSLNAVEVALNAYAGEIATLRTDGLTRTLSGDAADRFFALGFAIEQLHLDFKDLEQCVAEWGGSSRQAGRNKSV